MLLEFHVKNFRSIKDEQCLSFVASDEEHLTEKNCIVTNNSNVPKVVRSATIYGANASGKSNLIFSLISMRDLVLLSSNIAPNQESAILTNYYTPFRLGKRSDTNTPTKFEIILLIGENIYRYGFSYNDKEICEEWLYVNNEKWFERKNKQDSWEFSSNFRGQLDSWKEMTRPNSLFLTTAVQFNSEQLKPISDWFFQKLVIIQNVEQFMGLITQEITNKDYKEKVLKLLNKSDIHIADIKTEEKEGVKLELGKPQEPIKISDIEFCHKTEDGESVWFDRRYESLGTQRLLCYSGVLQDVLGEGKLLVVDEFDSNLHPMLAHFLIENTFHSADSNAKNAQFLITTHNTNLLSAELFREDQIWFVEKNEKQSTQLYSLAEFKENEASSRIGWNLEYLIGRYGAIPFLKKYED